MAAVRSRSRIDTLCSLRPHPDNNLVHQIWLCTDQNACTHHTLTLDNKTVSQFPRNSTPLSRLFGNKRTDNQHSKHWTLKRWQTNSDRNPNSPCHDLVNCYSGVRPCSGFFFCFLCSQPSPLPLLLLLFVLVLSVNILCVCINSAQLFVMCCYIGVESSPAVRYFIFSPVIGLFGEC